LVTDYIKEFMKQHDFETIYKKIIKSGDTFPMVWVKTGIDWSKGDVIQTQDIKIKRNGSNETKEFVLREGRPFVNIIPLHEIFPDNLKVDSIDQVKELVYRTPMHLDYIEAKYGFQALAEAIDAVYTMNRYDLNIYSDPDREYAYVYEYYKAPDSKHPDGRFTTVINDYVVSDGPLPYENGSYGTRVIPFDIINIPSCRRLLTWYYCVLAVD
jgi:hypothetical protein